MTEYDKGCGCLKPLSMRFIYTVTVSFIGGENQHKTTDLSQVTNMGIKLTTYAVIAEMPLEVGHYIQDAPLSICHFPTSHMKITYLKSLLKTLL